MNVPAPIDGTIFGEAWKAGVKETGLGGPASQWYPDLQVTHTLKMSGYEEYTNQPGVRLRRHLLIYGPSGWLKSTTSKRYLTKACECVPVSQMMTNDGAPTKPTIFYVEGTSSYEALVGSCSGDGELLRPMFAMTDYIYSSELFAFLGNDGSGKQKDMVDKLGMILEEGHVNRRLVKLRSVELTDSDRLWMYNNGVELDVENGILEYDANSVMVGCTRPLNREERITLEESGFDDRLFYSKFKGTKDQIRDMKSMGGPRFDDSNFDRIVDFNRKLFKTEFEELPAPPHNMYMGVYNYYCNIMDELVEDVGLTASTVFSARDFMVCKQLLTAAAIERTIRGVDVHGLESEIRIPTLQYLDVDTDVAKYFVEQYAQHRRDELSRQYDEDVSDVEWNRANALAICINQYGNEFETGDICDLAMNSIKTVNGSLASRRTVFNMLSDWQDYEWVEKVSHGKYAVTADGKDMMQRLSRGAVEQNRRRDPWDR